MQKDVGKKRRARFWRFLYFAVVHTLPKRSGYTFDPIELEPPFLLISNHVTNDDPFYTGLSYKNSPLAYVASEHIFRKGFISKLLMRYFYPIPRPKADSGVGTVRAVLKRLREGDPVALFAEGDCTWNGVSGSVFPATGKLAKAAGVPLVTYRLEGGYLTSPRWSKKHRKGRMHGRVVRIYGADELKAMTADEVETAINRDIHYDTWEEQKKDPVPFRAKAPAEGLERALFICPECGGADCMSTKGNELYCSSCGAKWKLDEYGFLNGPRFSTVREWDEWQKNAVRNVKRAGLFEAACTLTDLDAGAKKKKTTVSLDTENKVIRMGDGGEVKLSDITDMAMIKTVRLLFTDGAGYHEIQSKRGVLRPYLAAWQAYREETEDR
ncbi:MAG: 1-acyl-sn-glycerol-3-phosphate acyltransferase [Clostridia bacterium]|nr:1-acyl-sn-glycerol-3-phosphate acyltransferase [Clostridia bacterium]